MHVCSGMRTISLLRIGILSTAIAFAGSSISCTTTYDAYGRPVQSVDPGVAVAGAAAAGAIGYSAGRDRNDRRYYRGPHYYRGSPYYGGYNYGRGGYRY